jgi:NADPH:quinone reductase-like Zn-dependent oxidoreductase
MRAVRFHEYGPPSVLAIEEVARPKLKKGEVLVRVRAAGVNAVDWKFRAGHLKDFLPLELRHTPGLDVARTVAEVGAGVSGFSPGEDVFGRGTVHDVDVGMPEPGHIVLQVSN